MINKDTYHALLNSPQKIDVDQMESLAELVHEFPYSQNIRQLYLKALYQNQSIKFENELKKTAAFTFSRSHLKSFILKEYSEIKPEPILRALAKDTSAKASPPASNKLEVVASENQSSKETKLPTIVDKTMNDDFLTQAINASISIEVSQQSDESYKYTTPKEEGKEGLDQKRSFIQWIKHYDQEQQQKALDREQFKKKAALLIDDFISKQPKITPKKDFYSPIDMASKSIENTDEVVSETLAKIILQQGNPNKAIKMYQSLSLKFPEKKAYFADEIEKIRIAIKNKS